MTGGLGNKRGTKSSVDYQREWDTLILTLVGLIVLGLLVCWAFTGESL